MRNKRIAVWPSRPACAIEHESMDMTVTADVVFVLISALLALPLALAVCLRHPSLTTLTMIAILCVFSSSTWGQPPQQLLLPPKKRPRQPSANR